MFAKNLATWAGESDPHKQKILISSWIAGRAQNLQEWRIIAVDTWRMVRDFQPELLDAVSDVVWEGVSQTRATLSELLEGAGVQFFYDREALGYGDFIERICSNYHQHSPTFTTKQRKNYNWAETCTVIGGNWGRGAVPQYNMIHTLMDNNCVDVAVFIAGCIRAHHPNFWDKSEYLFTTTQHKQIGAQSLLTATEFFNKPLAIQTFGLSFDEMVDVLEKTSNTHPLWAWFNHILYTPEIYMDGANEGKNICCTLLKTIAEQFGDSIVSSRYKMALIEFHNTFLDVSGTAEGWAQMMQKLLLEEALNAIPKNPPAQKSKI